MRSRHLFIEKQRKSVHRVLSIRVPLWRGLYCWLYHHGRIVLPLHRRTVLVDHGRLRMCRPNVFKMPPWQRLDWFCHGERRLVPSLRRRPVLGDHGRQPVHCLRRGQVLERSRADECVDVYRLRRGQVRYCRSKRPNKFIVYRLCPGQVSGFTRTDVVQRTHYTLVWPWPGLDWFYHRERRLVPRLCRWPVLGDHRLRPMRALFSWLLL